MDNNDERRRFQFSLSDLIKFNLGLGIIIGAAIIFFRSDFVRAIESGPESNVILYFCISLGSLTIVSVIYVIVAMAILKRRRQRWLERQVKTDAQTDEKIDIH